MKTIINQLLTVLFILTLLFPASFLQAAETTFELQKRIKSDFSKIEKADQAMSSKTNELNKEIKEIVTKFTNTINEGEKEELRKQYVKKRAEFLKAIAEWAVEIVDALSRIAKNMALLEKEMNRSIPGDHVKGLSHSDTNHIRNTLKGTANILSLIQKLKPNDPEVNNLARTLLNLDLGYKTHFSPGGDIDLNKQIAYVEDLHAYMNSVKILLRQETNYLKENVYYMMKDGIVRVISDFRKQFYSPNFRSFEDEHETDTRILGERGESENEEYNTPLDLNNIGNW